MITRYVTSSDSTRLAFDVTGAGTPLVLLHGGGGSRADWHETGYVTRLRDQFTVITMDLRGHGGSDKHVDPAMYTTDKMGQDILSVADACRVDRFILWGYSFGGNVGRYLAARSERVSKTVMLGSRMSGSSNEHRQFILEFRARWEPVVGSAGEAFNPKSLPQKDQDDIRELSFPGELLPSVLAWSTAMLDWDTVTPTDFLCPTLWLIGTENKSTLDTYREHKTEILASKVQVHFLEGLNHEEEFNNIDQVLPLIQAFLRDNAK
jgi:pimeloyl-ACP methyl ester carboxylesterase